jgi:L-lactate dehydrogenase complex protein LldF
MSNEFRKRIRRSLTDANLQAALDANAERRKTGRLSAFASVSDYQERRQRAHDIKAEVIAHLDEYLAQFIAKVKKNSIIVHRAKDAGEAIRIFLEIARSVEAKVGATHTSPLLVAKSKSMVSEEINLNHALEAVGYRVVETDLGEYIVQLRGERPSHIITPAVHLRRGDVGKLFEEKLGIPYTEDIPTLTNTARRVLRDVFLTADIGVSGVNFGVAETGTLCIVTNEGNGRMVTTLPPVHIALMGIERLVPTLDDLALFLSLLPRSATGQKLSVYTSLIHSPKRLTDPDGPLERHLILVDNGRSTLLASPLREALYCIRCGACLNACPVFREIGGHAYVGNNGSITPYPGPIGSVISPGLFGCENYGHLAQASSLCGACKEACPVDIDLPGLLLRVRSGLSPRSPKNGDESTQRLALPALPAPALHRTQDGVAPWPGRQDRQAQVAVRPGSEAEGNTKEGVGIPFAVKFGLKGFRFAAGNASLFAVFQSLGGILSRVYSPRRAYMRIPTWTGWGYSKDFPRLAVSPFRARWKKINCEEAYPKQRWQANAKKEQQKCEEPGDLRASHCVLEVAVQKPLAAQFIEELTALSGNVIRVAEKDLTPRMVDFLHERGIERVVVDDLGAELMAAQAQQGIQIVREPAPSVRAGITGALVGIADTGTLVMIGGEGRPLTASLLPEIHIAILRASEILPSLPEALRKPEVREAAAGVIITGPSRTADIEMTLTIGVHGSSELHVFLIDDSDAV